MLIGVGAVLWFWLSALLSHHGATPDSAYFNHLADSFIHGHLYLPDPPGTHDLTQYAGRWYVPFPPLAAILMMPFVAVLGVARFNTVFFAAVLGGINVGLMHAFLRRLDARRIVTVPPGMTWWLTIAYGVGSVHWYMATQGSVWFLGHLAAAVFVLLSLNFAATDRVLASGVALGVASLGRPTVLLMAPLVVGLLLAKRDSTDNSKSDGAHATSESMRRLAPLASRLGGPAVVFVAVLLLYNRLRFGSFTEFGYAKENVAQNLVGDLAEFGQFNVHFIRHNLWAMLLAGPEWIAERSNVAPNPFGLSMLLTTPALVYSLRAMRRVPLTLWSWGAVALMLVPLLLYYNTGWYQFGYRFSLDFMPALVVLMGIGLAGRVTWSFRVLVLLGVAVNLWGVAWFN